MKFTALILSSVALLSLSACSQPASKASALKYGTTSGAGSAGVHTVLEGDSVYSISKSYQLPIRDIVTFNDISAPYRLTVGYRVKLPPPREYRVRPKDTIQAIAKLHDTTPSAISRLNNLSAPYRLRVGQTLRLPTPQPEILQTASASTVGREVKTVNSARVERVEREVLNAPKPGAKPASVPQANVPQAGVTSKPTAKVQSASASTRAALPKKVPARSGNGKFMMPVRGKVISSFGPKADGLHNDGINIKAPKGTPVRAAENGVVVYAGNELEGYGNLILVRHENQWMTAYAHMDKFLAKRGDTVKRGQSIGTVGSTGQVDTSQLHFEIRRGTDAKNPDRYL